jgi:hypothetical protein
LSLKANQTDTIATAGGINNTATSMTLTTGAFDNKTSGDKVPLVIDPDNAAKLEVVTAYISGTAVTSMVRGQNGTAATSHSQGATVIIGSIPAAWEYWFKNDLASSSLPTTIQPQCGLTKSANQAIVTATLTPVTFDTETFDTDTMHSTVSNTSRITIQTAGTYLVTGQLAWATAAAKGGKILLYKNGSVYQTGIVITSATYYTHPNITCIMQLAVNDYVEFYAYQDSGSNLNILGGATDEVCRFAAIRISA